MIERVLGGVRGLLPVLGIAVGVAVLGTATGFAWDHVHKVAADEIIDRGTPAEVGPDGTQVLKLPAWGVAATLPLVSELPLVSFAPEAGDTVGLSSADLMKLGVECQPARNALGSITRYPTGAYGTTVKARVGANVVSTVDAFDYVYQFPQTACADKDAGVTTVNRETAIVLEALGSLTATK